MTDFASFVVILVFGALALAAFFVGLSALFPERVARIRATASRAPGRSLFLGLINAIFFLALILALQALAGATEFPLFALPGAVLFVSLCLAALFGLAAVAELVGERILPERPRFARVAVGAVVLGLGCALPVAGWFGLLPYIVLLGLGAFALSLFEPARPA